MPAITLFLLGLIAVLVPANILLWATEKRNIPKATNLQNNGILTEINELKIQQESIYSRISALENTNIKIQKELNKIKPLKSIEQFSKKKK